MKRDYSMFYYVWGNKCKVNLVLGRLLKSNIKRQMTPAEGLIFIRLMEKQYHRRRHGRRTKR